ncbi:condensation domain-containing protein [Pseudoalteromonas sp. MMG022]|uniref:non-ribosomal peptide synthetase n=1 Tax=Pseudoalteromonas sp. MMG022 TaxID=2909978 RepID=UPI0031BA69F6|nr:condensation domain-containing protein [Pseudoalteromonas sp. MMG022]
MNISELIDVLKEKGIKIGLSEQGQLVVRGTKEALGDDLKRQLKEQKPMLIEWLSIRAQGEDSGIRVLEDRQAIYPMSYSQKRLWFIDKLQGQNAVFNLPSAFHLTGQFSIDVAKAAFQQILDRHESLRTIYFEHDGEPAQYVLPQADIPFEVNTDCIGLDWSSEQVQAVLKEDVYQPFLLEQDIKIRVTVVQLGEQEWVLQINIHHISADGMSMKVLVEEYNKLYNQIAKMGMSDLPLPKLQYLDFSQWQRESLNNDSLKPHLDYWKNTLAGIPKCHSIPLQHPRPEFQSYEAGKVTTHIEASKAQIIEGISKEHGATIFMSMLANLSLLVNRYSGDTDMVFGTPTAGRFLPALENIFGLFVNNLVLRINLDECQTYSDLLRYTKQRCLEGYSHQQVPFEVLVEELAPQRNTGYNPIFQISIAMQDLVDEALELDGVEVSTIKSDDSMGRYDLSLLITDSTDGLVVEWLYNATLFERAMVESFAEDFLHLLVTTSQSPQIKLSEIALPVNQTTLSAPQTKLEANSDDENIDSLILSLYRTMDKFPDQTALIDGDLAITYSQLVEQVESQAHLLMEKGLQSGDKVGVVFSPSTDLIVCVLAVLRLGACYVPIEPHYPQERMVFQVVDSAAKMVISDATFSWWEEETNLPPLVVYSAEHTKPADIKLPSLSAAKADQAAYVIYTSGSTGTPKGVEISQYSLAHFMLEIQAQLVALTPELPKSWVWSHSFAFDASIKSFALLASGTSLILPDVDTMVSPSALVELLNKYEVPIFNTMPSVAPALLEELERQSVAVNLIVSGDDIGQSTWTQLKKYNEKFGVNAINAYGPTETTVNASYCLVNGLSMPAIGSATHGHQLFIVDRELNEVPVGARGEIAISGPGLAMSYLNKAQLFEERFIASDAKNNKKGQAFYLTGDMGVKQPNGLVSFLGRKDRQVKVRGFRVELDEIDNLIKSMPEVQEVHSWLREDASEQLISFVCLADIENASTVLPIIQSHIRASLPSYMHPNKLIPVDAMLRTTSGKVSPSAMWKLYRESSVLQPESLGGTEKALMEIWCELLDVNAVGVTDNFFELGGHSLLAMTLIAEIRSRFGVGIQIKSLLVSPTIAALAALIDKEQQPTTKKTEVLL